MRAQSIVSLSLALTGSLASAHVLAKQSRDPDGFPSPTVTIKDGPVVGTRVPLPSSLAMVNQFLGIPYADSPPARFEPPKPPKPWKEPLETKERKPTCIQQFAYPKENVDILQKIFNNPPSKESEDCLYLNVFRSENPGEGKAVLFWLYPGGLQFGDGSRPEYDGSVLAGFHDVIVVTLSYRSNVFGFSSSPELALEERNAGLYDQRLALQWVQDNIAAFGGDPKKVTIFGNSAGGTSVDRMLLTYPRNPPFHAAIIQSGQASFGPYDPLDGEELWWKLAGHFGCKDAKSPKKCLTEVDAVEMGQYISEEAMVFPPITDNVTQLSAGDARRARKERTIAQVPVMIGSNNDEGSFFWRQDPDGFEGFLKQFLPDGRTDLQDLMKHLYPLGDEFPTQYSRLTKFFTDLTYGCPTAFWANASAEAGFPTWRYFYNASFPSQDPVGGMGAYHSSEIPLIFGTYNREGATPEIYALSENMQRVWTEFAKNPIAGPGWNKIGLMGAESLAYIDDTTSGVTMVDPKEVDTRCWAYKQIYDVIEHPPWM